MASTPEKLKLAREKAKRLGKLGRTKGAKNKKTIAKEKAREAFELIQLKKWEQISEAQAKDAIKNPKAREYTINQVIGKPKETTELITPDDKPLIQIIIKNSLEKVYGKNKPRSNR